MRSFLFVPADGGSKLDKAMASGADAVIVDLEDSIAPERKAQARGLAASFLKEAVRQTGRPLLLVRINGLQTGLADADLDAVVPARPDAIMLPKAEGGAAVVHADAKLAAREAIAGIADGHIKIVAIATETAQVSSATADAVLEQLTGGRAVLYAATLAGSETSTIPFGTTSGGRRLDLEGQASGLERDKVFNAGTKQSGGLHISSQRTAGLWSSLERIAVELQRQYVVSYDSDARGDGTVTIESTRRAVTVRGPMRAK